MRNQILNTKSLMFLFTIVLLTYGTPAIEAFIVPADPSFSELAEASGAEFQELLDRATILCTGLEFPIDTFAVNEAQTILVAHTPSGNYLVLLQGGRVRLTGSSSLVSHWMRIEPRGDVYVLTFLEGGTACAPPLSASTTSPLIETTLDGSEVTLTLTGATYEQNLSNIRNAVAVSGIAGVTVGTVRRGSDTEVTVDLAFDGTNFDTDAVLTFTVEAAAIKNYDGSALTAEVPVTAIKGFDFDLSVSAGISLIHVPLKVNAVDDVVKTIESISDLYDALGGAGTVNFLITRDSQTQEWHSYFGPSDKGGPADRVMTDDMGIIVGLKAPVSVQLTGDALGTNGNSSINLSPGLNVVGMPLNDSRINRVSDLFTLDGIGGNVPVIILTDGGEFKAVGRAGDPGDIEITGGQAFIMTASRAATVNISGDAWANDSGAAAPPVTRNGIEVGNTTPVLGLRGSIVEERTGVNNAGFRITVKNLSTGRAVITVTGGEYFSRSNMWGQRGWLSTH